MINKPMWTIVILNLETSSLNEIIFQFDYSRSKGRGDVQSVFEFHKQLLKLLLAF